jgi:predicted enzyme related to lactoylglutathione lyase
VPTRQQFNVNLDPELVRRVKHQAIDDQLSLSEWVGRVLEDHLTSEEPMTEPTPPTSLFLQPMVHVQKMSSAVAFYEALGAQVLHGSRDGDFVMLKVGGAQLGLLAHPPNPEQHEGQVELNFETTGSLAELETRLRESGTDIAQPTTDEGFGRQLQLRSPDGLLVKINELDQKLYT